MKKSDVLPRSKIRIKVTTTIFEETDSFSEDTVISKENESVFISKDSGMISGVYEILNKFTGERYIGTSRNIRRRFLRHKEELVKGIHHCALLQQAWNRVFSTPSSEKTEVLNPDDLFEFNVIVFCRPSELFHYEHMLIKAIKPEYNTHMENGHSRARTAKREESEL